MPGKSNSYNHDGVRELWKRDILCDHLFDCPRLGVLLSWFIVKIYKTYKYTARYVTPIDGYRNKLVLKFSSTEDTSSLHEKKVNKKTKRRARSRR